MLHVTFWGSWYPVITQVVLREAVNIPTQHTEQVDSTLGTVTLDRKG